MAIDIKRIAARLSNLGGRSEADIQSDVRTVLLDGDLDLDTDDLVEVALEAPAGGGRRIDIEVGYTVIEVKKHDLSTHEELRARAVDQLTGYVRARSLATGNRYVGILTDGRSWFLYHLRPEGDLRQVSKFLLSSEEDGQDLVVWLEGVLATRQQIQPTPEEIESRLGYRSSSFELDLADLAALYDVCREEPEVKLKRQLWSRLLTSALGTNFRDEDSLFIRHTYLTLSAELIAHFVVGLDPSGPGNNGYALLSGEMFRKAKIFGVVDADFFDWPVETERGERLVRSIARRLGRFVWSEVHHDVLKVLYQSVIDADTRHSLGEYYTPDWLAERVVAEAITDPMSQKILDPACGSGTFLFWAIRKYLDEADALGWTNAEALEGVTNQVFGIDLHPVAVTLARVTYLLAIGLERLQDRGELSIPVYLGDSMHWEQDESLLTQGGVLIHAREGAQLFTQDLFFPERVVANAPSFDRLVNDLMDRATTRERRSKVPSIAPLLTRYDVHVDDRSAIEETFRVLCQLHDDRDDHIWSYYIRNRARPVWFTKPENRVDVVIGNPPWLAYRYMSDGMQSAFRRLSEGRHLWEGAKVATHQDLSALFFARSVEMYLKPEGTIAFVMPAAVLSRQQYEGFRRADFSTFLARNPVGFETPWDLTGIEPPVFPVPPSVVFAVRQPAAGVMGDAVLSWSGSLPQHQLTWREAQPYLSTKTSQLANTSRTGVSRYHEIFTQGATVVPRVLLVVQEVPAGPLGAPTGTTPVASRRTNQEKAPWKAMESLTGNVESEYVWPLYLGESIAPFWCTPTPPQCVVPWNGRRLLSGENEYLDDAPGLADWWRRAEEIWESNRSDSTTLDLRAQIDYRAKLSKQFPIPEHRVVYAASGSNLTAARLEDPRGLVEHALYWAPVGSVTEGQYLCAILNSETLLDRIKPLQARGQFGRRHFDKYVFYVRFPLFNPDIDLHQELALAASEAEQIAESVNAADDGWRKNRRRTREALIESGVVATINELVSRLVPEEH